MGTKKKNLPFYPAAEYNKTGLSVLLQVCVCVKNTLTKLKTT